MNPMVLLVHGANHDGWCWTPVLERLDRAGVQAAALDLPLSSFAADTDAVRDALDDVGPRPVVLVAHSYAGLPVAAGGHRADRQVLVAARMPAPGESPAALTPRWGHPEFRAAWSIAEDGAVTLQPSAADALYNRSPANLAELAAARWRPQYSQVPIEPIADPSWTGCPTTYVVCARDRAVRVEAQRLCAAWADEVVELDCDHSPFLSAPDDLAMVLISHVDSVS